MPRATRLGATLLAELTRAEHRFVARPDEAAPRGCSAPLDVEVLVDGGELFAREREVALGAIERAVDEHGGAHHPNQMVLALQRDQDVLDLVLEPQLVADA